MPIPFGPGGTGAVGYGALVGYNDYLVQRAELERMEAERRHLALTDDLAVKRNRREDELEQLALGEKKYQSEREKVQQEIESMDIGAFYSPELLERAKKYNVPLHDRRKTVTAAGLPEVQQMPASATEAPRVAPGAGTSVRVYAGTPTQQVAQTLPEGTVRSTLLAGGSVGDAVSLAKEVGGGPLQRQRDLVLVDASGKPLPPERQQPVFTTRTGEDVTGSGQPLPPGVRAVPRASLDRPEVFVDPRKKTITDPMGTVLRDIPPGAHVNQVPAPPQPATVVVQTENGPQLVNKRTGEAKPLTNAKGDPVYGPAGKPLSDDAVMPLAVMVNAGMSPAKLMSMGLGGAMRSRVLDVAAKLRSGEISVPATMSTLLGDVADVYSLQQGLNKLTTLSAPAKAAAKTASDNLDLALKASNHVARTDAKFVNEFVNRAVRNLTPGADLSDFETKVFTAIREYAKVASGGSSSAAGLTESATREATALLNSAQSPDVFAAAVGAMRADMDNIIRNWDTSRDLIKSQLNTMGAKGAGQSGSSDTTPLPTPKRTRYDMNGNPIKE